MLWVDTAVENFVAIEFFNKYNFAVNGWNLTKKISKMELFAFQFCFVGSNANAKLFSLIY